jgi:hypothetical protein
MTHDDRRPVWQVTAPPGGWPPPWPQLVEIVRVIPHTQWTLVGGVMVQLHAAHAGMQLTRPTRDVDMILHIETGAATFSGVRHQLEQLGYTIHEPVGQVPVHRFDRGVEQVDVMVADHLPPKWQPKALGRNVFGVPGGTSALHKTVNCEVDTGEEVVVVSIPDVLGALVLKGAAYTHDSRDQERHLDDAAVLACAVTDPIADRSRMIGNDQRRVRVLWKVLQDLDHRSWIATGRDAAARGHAALRLLAAL